jgi:hypothetical protein
MNDFLMVVGALILWFSSVYFTLVDSMDMYADMSNADIVRSLQSLEIGDDVETFLTPAPSPNWMCCCRW